MKSAKQTIPGVSVIVPVYNVEEYIEACLRSITEQTFSDLEIILVLGDSQDRSSEIVGKWAETDTRIHIVREETPGVGMARNTGLKYAHGEYIQFIDSDDYIDKTMIEKMYKEAVKSDADLVECDFYRIRSYSEQKEYNVCTEIMGRRFSKGEKLLLGNVMLWKLLIRKELFDKYRIVQPNPPREDMSIYPLLLFYAKRFSCVSEPLYYYRKERPNNLSSYDYCNEVEKNIKTVDRMLKEIDRRGLLREHETEMAAYCRRWISRMYSPTLGRMENALYKEYRDSFLNLYEDYFGKDTLFREALIGSYNLSKIVNKLDVIEDPYTRFHFASLIGLVRNNTKKPDFAVEHNNIYRQYMLRRQAEGELLQILLEEKPQFLFMDFMEERFDIAVVDGVFLSINDAFEGLRNIPKEELKVIPRNSDECRKLWEDSFEQMISVLRQSLPLLRIVIVENYLTTAYSDGKNRFPFPEQEQIAESNAILTQYYEYVHRHHPELLFVPASTIEDYVTDIHYEYGCKPENLSEWGNMEIADQIRKRIDSTETDGGDA